MTEEDLENRRNLAITGGKTKFVIEKHREKQQKIVEEMYKNTHITYDNSFDKNIYSVNTHKICEGILKGYSKEIVHMNFMQKIKNAVSMSKETREKRQALKLAKKILK